MTEEQAKEIARRQFQIEFNNNQWGVYAPGQKWAIYDKCVDCDEAIEVCVDIRKGLVARIMRAERRK